MSVELKKSECQKGFSFMKGRASRREYWSVVLTLNGMFLLFAITAVMSICRHVGSIPGFSDRSISLAFAAVGLIFSASLIPVTVRRYHDLNLSGWFVLFQIAGGLVPYLNVVVGLVSVIFLGAIKGSSGDNKYGIPIGDEKAITKSFFSIAGRSPRREYLNTIFSAIIVVGFLFANLWIFAGTSDSVMASLLIVIPSLIGTISFPVTIRRCHDLSIPGWVGACYILTSGITYWNLNLWFGLIMFICLGCLPGKKVYDKRFKE